MSAQVACPQCGHTYRITYPSGGIVVITLDSFEKMTQRICPILFGGLCIGTVYWFGITFGAVTVMQVSTLCQALFLKADLGTFASTMH